MELNRELYNRFKKGTFKAAEQWINNHLRVTGENWIWCQAAFWHLPNTNWYATTHSRTGSQQPLNGLAKILAYLDSDALPGFSFHPPYSVPLREQTQLSLIPLYNTCHNRCSFFVCSLKCSSKDTKPSVLNNKRVKFISFSSVCQVFCCYVVLS